MSWTESIVTLLKYGGIISNWVMVGSWMPKNLAKQFKSFFCLYFLALQMILENIPTASTAKPVISQNAGAAPSAWGGCLHTFFQLIIVLTA